MKQKDSAVSRRLRSYWKMEAVNVAFVPAFAAIGVWYFDGTLTPAFWLNALACSALLFIGTIYLRAISKRADGDRRFFDQSLPWLAKAETPAAVLVVAAVAAWIGERSMGEPAISPSGIASALLAALATLEYVNYYRVQLQHFDNAADFKRLMSGRGFRKSHMARDIAHWRLKKRLAANPVRPPLT